MFPRWKISQPFHGRDSVEPYMKWMLYMCEVVYIIARHRCSHALCLRVLTLLTQ